MKRILKRTSLLLFILMIVSLLFIAGCDDGTIESLLEDNSEDSVTETETWADMMADGDYDSALIAVEAEIKSGSTDPEDYLYASLLNIAKMSTSSGFSTIASAAGIADYPTDFSDLMTMEMAKTTFQYDGYVYNPETQNYEQGTITSILPSINDKDGNPVTSITGFDDYIMIIVENLVTEYSNGLNSPINSMISVYNSVMPKVNSYLEALAAMDSISITKEMVGYSYTDINKVEWLEDENGNEIPVVIGKAEILMLSSYFNMLSGCINYAGSLDYSFPLAELYDSYFELEDLNGQELPLAFFENLPDNPMGTLLNASSAAESYLSASKTFFIAGVDNLLEAVELFHARSANSEFMFCPSLFGQYTSWDGIILKSEVYEDENGDYHYDEYGKPIPDHYINRSIGDLFSVLKIFLTKVQASIKNGDTIYFQIDLFTTENFSLYADADSWPKDADWGTPPSDGVEMKLPSVPAINIGAFFNQPFFALDSLFAVDGETGEPIVYDRSGDSPVVIDEFTESMFNDPAVLASDYAFKLKDCTLGGILQDVSDEVVVSWIDVLAGITDGFVNVEKGSSSEVFIKFETKDVYYSMFNTAGTVFTSDVENLDNADRWTLGSFWYYLWFMSEGVISYTQTSP